MRFVFVTADSVVARVMEKAASLRGHECMSVQKVSRLHGALPFIPSVVVLSLRRFDRTDDAELADARRSCPGASIVVTAETISPAARSAALRSGVIDVIQVPYNPFDLITLVEHWQAFKPSADKDSDVRTVSDLTIDLRSYLASKNGRPLQLTRLELRLLYCLIEHYPNVAPADRLLSFGWGQSGDPDVYLLKTHMSHMRRRLLAAGGAPVTIRSRHSIGYSLVAVEVPIESERVSA